MAALSCRTVGAGHIPAGCAGDDSTGNGDHGDHGQHAGQPERLQRRQERERPQHRGADYWQEHRGCKAEWRAKVGDGDKETHH